MGNNITTISTANGSTVSIGHNIRAKAIVDRENEKWMERHPGEYRIDPNGHYEIWHHQPLAEAYEQLFGDAIREYNERQIKHGTPDRCINNYLQSIQKKDGTDSKAKHAVYEMIFSVGRKDNPIMDDVGKQILREMVDEFAKQNSHLYVTGIYYHADETGVPHVHLDYIPWTDDVKRGPRIQNGLKSALRQQGIVGENKHDTAQMRWQRQMNDTLEAICKKYGYEVDHYQRGQGVEHKTVERYRIDREIADRQQQLAALLNLPSGKALTTKAYIEQLETIARQYAADKILIDQAKRDILAASKEFAAYEKALANLERKESDFDGAVNEAANKKVSAMEGCAIDFINSQGLQGSFALFRQQITSVSKKATNQQKQ